jgi:hypothetical protein
MKNAKRSILHMGGADQIAQPDERLVGDALEAKIPARR